jgi:large subunit ribosomal protein L3
MLGLIGKKVGMTQVYDSNGVLQPVTVIQAGPCVVTQVKTETTDGYTALQLGYEEVKEKKLNKPLLGHLKKNNLKPLRYLKEFRVNDSILKAVGQKVDVSLFNENDKVDISGKSIGKGFQGNVKRHHFGRGPMTHGSKNHRLPGSIGAGTTPSRVYKGKRMAGRMGNKKVTVKNLTVVKVDKENNLLIVKGSVPGVEGGLLVIKPAVKVGKQ